MKKDNFKTYLNNSFTYIQYNKFESDIFWGVPYNRLIKLDSLDILNSQFKVNRFNIVKNLTHNVLLEVAWTIIPIIILLSIALPSMQLLYFMENPLRQSFAVYDCTITIIAHQWFWAYQYIDCDLLNVEVSYLFSDYFDLYNQFVKIEGIWYERKAILFYDYNCGEAKDVVLDRWYDNMSYERVAKQIQKYFVQYTSYIMSNENVKEQLSLRLLDADFALIVPVGSRLRFLITSDDVIHSWALPSLGIKTDAIPGRISLATTVILEKGVFFGQCSEICGIGHGFMPIKVIAL